jgi:hypothetical protein
MNSTRPAYNKWFKGIDHFPVIRREFRKYRHDNGIERNIPQPESDKAKAGFRGARASGST